MAVVRRLYHNAYGRLSPASSAMTPQTLPPTSPPPGKFTTISAALVPTLPTLSLPIGEFRWPSSLSRRYHGGTIVCVCASFCILTPAYSPFSSVQFSLPFFSACCLRWAAHVFLRPSSKRPAAIQTLPKNIKPPSISGSGISLNFPVPSYPA